MRRTVTIAGSVILAIAVGVALFLRPKPLAREELPVPSYLPAAAREALRGKMGRHDLLMQALLSRVVLLDTDGVARTAGAIFDEPPLTRPGEDDALQGRLPKRFFVLQDELRERARRLVAASVSDDRAALAEEFAGLAKSCVACHQVYLFGDASPAAR